MKSQIALWTPLIGFDVNKPDKGAAEYLKKCGLKPSLIALFLYNADFITLHEGMETEKAFPPDYCNYYGSPCNEIRGIQKWTNYDLRELVAQLKGYDIAVHCSIMGNHICPPEGSVEPQGGGFGYTVCQEYMLRHRELATESTIEEAWGHAYMNPLKRFPDGTWFEDYLIAQAARTLADYGMDGLHMADCLFPPNKQINSGDFSDDMLDQFMTCSGVKLPDSIVNMPLTKFQNPEIAVRAAVRRDYIWAHCREEWIRFHADRWARFFKKMCGTLHQIGRQVMVCSAWTTEPFEALYRFGIDYRALGAAGLDIVCIEDQATSVYSSEGEEWIRNPRYRIHEHMATPLIMRAYAPDMTHLGFNFAKDSTEECSAINHFPSANEREIWALTAPLYLSGDNSRRNLDGLFVCLADGLNASEWKWLKERYRRAFKEEAVKTFSATLVWSDAMQYAFLSEYIASRRWPCQRIVAELSRHGGKIGAAARIESLDQIRGAVLVPNIDLLPPSELKMLAGYRHGPVIFTSVSGKGFKLDGREPDVCFEDGHYEDEYRMCAGAYFAPGLDIESILSPLKAYDGKVEHSVDIEAGKDPSELEDTMWWFEDIPIRAVSKSFVRAAARLVCAASQDMVVFDPGTVAAVYGLKDGRVRVVAENDNLNQYKKAVVRVNKPMMRLENATGFPIQPLRLLAPNGEIRAPGFGISLQEACGFQLRMPPGGVAVVDLAFYDTI
ncbi:MAG: hypothetical protein FWE62_07050 [Firmicutes bacterium]|nr:hypothetical protein [Bacillota bacterium]